MSESPAVAIAVFLLALVAAGGVGMGVLQALGVPRMGRLDRWVFGCAVGLGLLAYAVLALGLVGLLRPALLWGLLALFAMAAVPAYLALAREREKGTRAEAPAPMERSVAAALFLYGAALAVLTLFGALAPPIDLDWDSLVYHLAAPKLYLAHGRIFFIDYDSHTNFPFTLEMLYTLGLATGGAGTAKLFHWATGWLTVLAIALLTRALVGRRAPLWTAPLAAVIFASIPQVAWEATTAYIDLGTTLYQFLALMAFISGVEVLGCWGVRVLGQHEGAADASGSSEASLPQHPNTLTPQHPNTPSLHPWFLLSGLLSGWAMGTKMTAVVPFALLAVWLGWLWLRSRERALLRAGALFVLAGALVASPWYIKSYLWTNNPVYPFFYGVFKHSVNWNAVADREYRNEQRFFGRGHDLTAFLYLPWNLTMHGADFFNVPFKIARPDTLQHHMGDVLGGISGTFLALLPLTLLIRRWDRRLTWLLVYSGLMVLVWFFLTQQSRYLLPVLAPLSVVVAVMVGWLTRPVLKAIVTAFLVLTLALHAGRLYALNASAIDLALGKTSRQEYLRNSQPDLYPALEFINTLPPASRVAFFQEVRGFYCDRDYFWANPGQNTLIPYESFRNGAALNGRALAAFLRQRMGATHALVNHSLIRGETNQLWYQLLQDAIDQRALVPVFATTNPRTGARRVVVYRIEG